MYHMGVFMPMPPFGKLLADSRESKKSIQNSGKGRIANVYTLGIIISFTGLPKRLIYPPPLC